MLSVDIGRMCSSKIILTILHAKMNIIKSFSIHLHVLNI